MGEEKYLSTEAVKSLLSLDAAYMRTTYGYSGEPRVHHNGIYLDKPKDSIEERTRHTEKSPHTKRVEIYDSNGQETMLQRAATLPQAATSQAMRLSRSYRT